MKAIKTGGKGGMGGVLLNVGGDSVLDEFYTGEI